MRKKMEWVPLILALLAVLLLFLTLANSKLIVSFLAVFSPIASKIHLSGWFTNNAGFYSYLKEGLIMPFINYRENNLVYFGLIIFAIVLLVILGGQFYGDNKNREGDRFFISTVLAGTALLGLDFMVVILIYILFMGLHEA